MIRPAEGFAARFQVRLIENRKTARTRQFIGTLILILAGLAFLYWLANPVIQAAMRSPAEWITTAVGYLLFILTSIQMLSEVSRVFLHLLPDFISPVGMVCDFFFFGKRTRSAGGPLHPAILPESRKEHSHEKKLLYVIPILILLLLPIMQVHAFTGNLDGRVIFGQSFTLKSGEVLDGDLVVFGGEATIEENASVKGNVVIIGGSLVMDGFSHR